MWACVGPFLPLRRAMYPPTLAPGCGSGPWWRSAILTKDFSTSSRIASLCSHCVYRRKGAFPKEGVRVAADHWGAPQDARVSCLPRLLILR